MSTIIDANITVHTAMAASYNANEPHYRPENRAKVRQNLIELRRDHDTKLLDVGCGTGFIIDLAKDLFEEIHGIDVTQAMLDRVDRSGGNVFLYRQAAEAIEFPDASFDMATAYAFLHHLEDYRRVLSEVHRVLRPGGCFYVDLEPNRLFWAAMNELETTHGGKIDGLSDIVSRELASVLHTDERVESEFGIPSDTFNKAEYTKAILGGIEPSEFCADARAAGFSTCEVRFEWYLGQGAVMHGQSFEQAAIVETYLRRALPLSSHLFKYLQFKLYK